MTANVDAILRDLPVFDAHVDSLQRQLDLGHDLGVRGRGHLDCERGREGGLGAVVFVSWVDPQYCELGAGGAFQRTNDLLAEFHVLLETHPDRVQFCGDGKALDQAHEFQRIAAIAGIEGGHSIEEKLENLDWFHERGVRVLTLVWNNHLSWIRSCQPDAGPEIPPGLSDFGRDVVRRMNELGMVVDLSHAGVQSFYDALEVSKKPVIASHSGCMSVNRHVRNLTDDQLRALKRNGGVVGIVFCTPFLSAEAGAADAAVRETPEWAAISGDNDTDEFLKKSEYLQLAAPPLSADVVLEHIQHAVEIAGIDHVGLGSDFDGIQRTPQGLEDASCYGTIAEGLLARGFSTAHVEQILGGNMRRVFREVTG